MTDPNHQKDQYKSEICYPFGTQCSIVASQVVGSLISSEINGETQQEQQSEQYLAGKNTDLLYAD